MAWKIILLPVLAAMALLPVTHHCGHFGQGHATGTGLSIAVSPCPDSGHGQSARAISVAIPVPGIQSIPHASLAAADSACLACKNAKSPSILDTAAGVCASPALPRPVGAIPHPPAFSPLDILVHLPRAPPSA